jgi:hypothetical protein
MMIGQPGLAASHLLVGRVGLGPSAADNLVTSPNQLRHIHALASQRQTTFVVPT